VFQMALGTSIKDRESALTFIHQNVNGLLKQGEFPEYFGLTDTRTQQIGCTYMPRKITWGSWVGYTCTVARGHPMPNDNSVRCEDNTSMQIAVICPDGWVASCADGCTPPEISRVTERVEFWEMAIAGIIKTGYHYTLPSPDYIEACGCEGSKVRLIEYGSGVGFDCVLKDGWEQIYDRSHCWTGDHNCKDDNNKEVMTFCPVGYTFTCVGCIAAVPGLVVDTAGNMDDRGTASKTIEDKLGWLVDVLAGYGRLTQRYIGWMPDTHRALACACKEKLHPVEYGMHIGHICKIWDAQAVKTDECGLINNVVCVDHEGDYALHMCPEGYVPSCDNGCTFPWEEKTQP